MVSKIFYPVVIYQILLSLLLGQSDQETAVIARMAAVPAEVIVRPIGGEGFIAQSGSTNEILAADHDAAAVIQAAIDYLPVNGGKIYVGAGSYRLARTLLIKNKHGVHIEGAARGMQANNQGGTVLWSDKPINLLDIDAIEFRLFGVTVSNILFFGSGKDNGKAGIVVRGTVDVLTFYNVGVNNCGIGMHLKGSTTGEWAKVLDAPQIYFCDPQRNGIGLFIERCHYGKVVGGEFSDNLEYGIKISSPENEPHQTMQSVKIMSITAVRNGRAGIIVGKSAADISIGGGTDIGGTKDGSGILITDEGTGSVPENIIINGIHSYNNSEAGVHVESGKHVIIQGSILSNHKHRVVSSDPPQKYGILIDSKAKDIVLSGNIAYGNGVEDVARN